MSDNRDPTSSTKARRIVGVLFGIFFLAVAFLILFTSSTSTRVAAIAAAVVIGGLGLDSVASAMRGKRSLLSRIGPLP
jgi:uncharacterized membrane protein